MHIKILQSPVVIVCKCKTFRIFSKIAKINTLNPCLRKIAKITVLLK